MKKGILWAVICIMVLMGLYACSGGGGGSSSGDNTTVSGYWAAYFTPQGSSTLPPEEYLQFSQSGSSVSMLTVCGGPAPLSGTLSGSSLSITATGVNITGTVSGNSITGNYTDDTGTGTWTATKLSAAPTDKQCVTSRTKVFFSPQIYCIQSVIDDPNHIIVSASLVGMSNTQSYTYDSVDKEWWDTGTRYCTATPTFPMGYSVTINFNDSTSSVVSRSVTTISSN